MIVNNFKWSTTHTSVLLISKNHKLVKMYSFFLKRSQNMIVTTLVFKFQLVGCTPHRCKYVVNIATNTPSEKRQKKARSIIPIPILLPDYVAGRRCNPDLRAPLVVTADNEAHVASQKNSSGL